MGLLGTRTPAKWTGLFDADEIIRWKRNFRHTRRYQEFHEHLVLQILSEHVLISDAINPGKEFPCISREFFVVGLSVLIDLVPQRILERINQACCGCLISIFLHVPEAGL